MFLLLIGTCSQVFAIDFSQALDHIQETVLSIGTIFEWKSQVSNLYQKALKLSKDNEIVSTTTSLDQLKDYYNDCNRVKKSDFINILYDSNISFGTTFGAILPEWTTPPTADEINKSYKKFFACKNITNPSAADRTSVNNEVQNVYYEWYANAYSLSTINQNNFGSDLFRNGSLDDSDFDLFVDIEEIGKLLFDQFTESPEILFYRLPTIDGATDSSLNDQSAYQVWGGGGSFPGTTWVPSETNSTTIDSESSSSSGSFSLDDQSSRKFSYSPVEDIEIQSFLKTTIPSSSASVWASALILWNQCLTWSDEQVIVEPVAREMDPAEYISGITNFINKPTVGWQVNEALLERFRRENPVSSWSNTSETWYAQSVANSYAEAAFGEATLWTCEYSCRNLPLGEQAQCELKCAKSCIQSCDSLTSLRDKALCVSDCTCFMIAGPNGLWREKMEDMYRIKFCKVPVVQQPVSRGKKVFSIAAIFQEISDVLEWLRDSGQMVEFSRTKEFLDGAIKIKFADNFAFKLQVSFKPLFPQRSTTAKLLEQEKNMRTLTLWLTDMNVGAPEADNYDKYLIISDPVRNAADSEPASSLQDIQDNDTVAQAAAEAAKTSEISSVILDDFVKIYGNQTNVVVMQNMITFLEDNQVFWHNLSSALLDMTKMSLELKNKIEKSK